MSNFIQIEWQERAMVLNVDDIIAVVPATHDRRKVYEIIIRKPATGFLI